MESSAHAQFNAAGVTVKKWLACALVLHACSPAPENRPVQTPQIAELILDAAQRAMGVWPDSGSFQLLADAAVQGPDEDFRTLIHSSTDGRMRMQQTPFGFLAGVGAAEGWFVDPESGQIEELGSRILFLRGHELHMLALLPRSRLSDARFIGTTPFDSVDALAVALSHSTGDSLVAYFHPSDTLPIGLRITSTEPHVIVHWSDWVERGGLRLFRKAVFRQAEEVFTYTYDRLELGPLPDSLFEAPARPNQVNNQ